MRPAKKKLLVATVGLAAINYIGCAEKPIQTGNLMAQPPQPQPTVADAQVGAVDAGSSAIGNPDAGKTVLPPDDHRFRTGNLMPPPPPPPSASVKKR